MGSHRPGLARLLCACCVLAAVVAPRAAGRGREVGAQHDGGRQAIRNAIQARIEQLRTDPLLVVGGERLLAPDVVAAFFEARAFAPAWTAGHRVADAVETIRQVEGEGLTPTHYHLGAIEALDEVGLENGAVAADLELLTADALAAVLDHVQFGKVAPRELNPNWNVDPRETAPPLETILAMVDRASSVHAGVERFVPTHFVYLGLKDALTRARLQASAGGWPRVPEGAALKYGTSDRRVAALRKRLAISGELAASTDVERLEFDEEVEAAVKRFQETNRLTPDGIVGRGTLDALNVTAADRVSQVRANLERARWVLPGLHDTFVLINLPAFKVYFIRDGRLAWETRAQVGKAARRTPTFRDDIEYLVFNPDWTVPPTILSQDVLAPMRRGDNAVARKGLQILDRHGRRVEPSTIDWTTASRSNFQYTLRQPPGPNNALGRVKFVFPNQHTVFLHDTPSQELFSADQRTFSSGCIRIEHALDLARLLLEGDTEWTPWRIDETLASRKTETVFLGESVPILIVYWTVSVGTEGRARFAKDIYRLDPPLVRALDTVPAPGSVRSR